jgi:hypothetical protein
MTKNLLILVVSVALNFGMWLLIIEEALCTSIDYNICCNFSSLDY